MQAGILRSGMMKLDELGIVLCALGVGSLGGTAYAQFTSRASVATNGAQAMALCSDAMLSADGRYVVFDSDATNLVPVDTNGFRDVFVRDRRTGTTTLVSVSSGGVQGNGLSSVNGNSISADGRYIAFYSSATNLVPADTNGFRDVFLRDMQAGTTTLVSVESTGAQGNGVSSGPTISADGRYVAFYSSATNLVTGDTNAVRDVFLHDVQTGITSRLSVDSSGIQGDGLSSGPKISADGRYVAFYSSATNLVPGDTNGFRDVFVRDVLLATTTRASVDSAGVQGDALSSVPTISADGRYVAFYSDATNLVASDTNAARDIFVRDTQAGITTRVSVDSAGAQSNGSSSPAPPTSSGTPPNISADGRFVAFDSDATNLVAGDTNSVTDTFVHDNVTGTTERIDVSSTGTQADAKSAAPTISSDGRFVGFGSAATNLVSGDTNAVEDIFVRDRNAAGMTSLCDPGVDGVLSCPCSNTPSGPGRGCDNSSVTGGAALSAVGLASLSTDSLVFTTSAELPTAFSVLVQGTSLAPSGQVFGRGVNCVGGSIKQLFTKTAVGGSITAPDFGAGDPTVSARSAALGDVIQPGESRWYFVFYRDPIAFCTHAGITANPRQTFNETQTGRIDWSL